MGTGTSTVTADTQTSWKPLKVRCHLYCVYVIYFSDSITYQSDTKRCEKHTQPSTVQHIEHFSRETAIGPGGWIVSYICENKKNTRGVNFVKLLFSIICQLVNQKVLSFECNCYRFMVFKCENNFIDAFIYTICVSNVEYIRPKKSQSIRKLKLKTEFTKWNQIRDVVCKFCLTNVCLFRCV